MGIKVSDIWTVTFYSASPQSTEAQNRLQKLKTLLALKHHKQLSFVLDDMASNPGS